VRDISKQAAPFPVLFSFPFHAFDHNHLWLLLSRVKRLGPHDRHTLESCNSIGECGIWQALLQAILAFLALHYTAMHSLPLLTNSDTYHDSIKMSTPGGYNNGNPGGYVNTKKQKQTPTGRTQKVRNSLSLFLRLS
jgi:hypothetical protein